MRGYPKGLLRALNQLVQIGTLCTTPRPAVLANFRLNLSWAWLDVGTGSQRPKTSRYRLPWLRYQAWLTFKDKQPCCQQPNYLLHVFYVLNLGDL